MNFTTDFLKQAQEVIKQVLDRNRQSVLQASENVELQFKDDASVVTTFDKQLELEFRDRLQKFDQSIGFEGEEHGAIGNRELFWLVDPIDGTESFTRGMPSFRSMVTLIEHGKPKFALVYRFVNDELFVATQGGGVYRNGSKTTVSQRPLSRARIELSTKLGNSIVWPVLAALENKIESFRMFDDFLYVVEGKTDGHLVYKSDTKPWDNAPRMLLIEEAGGVVKNIGSDDYDYRNAEFIATNPLIFDAIMTIITNTPENG